VLKILRIQDWGIAMKMNVCAGALRLALLACVLPPAATQIFAQGAAAGRDAVPALMVSDIHFEPFWDPAKTAQLAAAPASAWKAILTAPDSADRQARFEALESSCKARGVDTSEPLFESSLNAMRADAAGIAFITLSGDLISHSFSCKYTTLFPKATPGEYRAFVEKTIEYVLGSLRDAFPGAPVYAALGNNDSDCGDYQLDANSVFLADTGKVMAADFSGAEKKQVGEEFAAGGYFSARMPIKHTRMLVLDDLFMGKKYSTCAGKPDDKPAKDQIAWLKQQLEQARQNKEKVWVMAHIPTGVDPYSTISKGKDLCAGKEPTMFLSSEALTDTLASYGDVIQLAIFAHTHMDEMRLLVSDNGKSAVPVKMVASISPIDGNNSSFTVAEVDPATATLKDYRVIAASNKTGVDTAWTEEYDYAQAYQEPSFSADALGNLIGKFKADAGAKTPASESYLRNYLVGDIGRELTPFWPQYVCALPNHTADAYRACACAQ
jgi:sphingomyelin phosphodiesterase acid-like 3